MGETLGRDWGMGWSDHADGGYGSKECGFHTIRSFEGRQSLDTVELFWLIEICMGQRPEVLLPLRQDDIRSGFLDEQRPMCASGQWKGGSSLTKNSFMGDSLPPLSQLLPCSGGSDGLQFTQQSCI